MATAFTSLPVWVLVSVGFYFSLRILRFPDITVDATFLAGSAGAASMAMNYQSSLGGFFFAILLGAIGGALTGLLYLIYKTPVFKLLSSVLVMFSFYSINLRAMNMQADAQFSNAKTFFNRLIAYDVSNGMNTFRPVSTLFAFLICGIIICALYRLLKTDIGLFLRTIGSRPQIVSISGKKPEVLLILGLVISNSIVAIGGFLDGCIDANTNINTYGTVIHALAAVIFGEVLVKNLPFRKRQGVSVTLMVWTPVIGACSYQVVRSLVLWFVTHISGGTGAEKVFSLTNYDQNAIFAIILTGLILASRLKGNEVGSSKESEGI